MKLGEMKNKSKQLFHLVNSGMSSRDFSQNYKFLCTNNNSIVERL